MFGLLDSVKQAVDLRRSHSEESKIHNSGEKAVEDNTIQYSRPHTGMSQWFVLADIMLFFSVLDGILEEQRRKVCDKSTSLKLLRRQRHNNCQTQNVLSPVKTVIQPLSVLGLSASSSAHLFTHFSASTGLHLPTKAGRMDSDRDHELGEMRSQRKVHQRGQEGTENASGIFKEPGLRTGMSREGLHLRSQEEEESLHEIQKVIIGRKSSKKHKSK